MLQIDTIKIVFKILLKIVKNIIYVLYLGIVSVSIFIFYITSLCRDGMPVWDRYDMDVLESCLVIWIILIAVNVVSSIIFFIKENNFKIKTIIHTILAAICIICLVRLLYTINYEAPLYLPYFQ